MDHKDPQDHKAHKDLGVQLVALDHKAPLAQVEDPLVPLEQQDHKDPMVPQELDPLVPQEQLVLQDLLDHKD